MDEIIEIHKIPRPENAMKYDVLSKKVIANIERVVRASYHYKIFIYFLKNFLKQLSNF